MKWRKKTLEDIATMICGGSGNGSVVEPFFAYRSSSRLTRFFEDAETEFEHHGETRIWWVSDVLEKILAEPRSNLQTPSATFCRVIKVLMDRADATGEGAERSGALERLNATLAREGYEAFYAADRSCYLRHVATGTNTILMANPHRPLSNDELQRRELLGTYLDRVSEDELIEEVLLPLLRQLGFHRITAAGHKDKALEYGKDVWMRYTLPTQHVLYFGMQVKRDKLDAAGVTKGAQANVAEILNQALMMLGHEIFDPETNRQVLVDHAFIVAGGEITKAAKNWLGGRLDQLKRSQILFMDREDILNLFVVTGLPLPLRALPSTQALLIDDDFPF